ncbi:hypothetical protein AB7783_13985 [Tardiphaga sp. 172_B4_N1_3]|uniref:hypothetical protein n=1 Tax=Tardiphaga sp. 172_B4_N1_3 TaxID=3240787 RepID=UPI003F8A92E0
MSGDNVTSVVDAAQDDADARQRSTIGFPYNNLGDALEVAQAIHSHAGTSDCDDSQLSAWMNVSPKSSGFRMQLSAARMFGVIETTSGHHKLSPLGRMMVDPQREREARARAFQNVPLYKAIFENYKNGVLPPAAALERDMIGLGVAEKQTGRARQVFERSAEQAGYFEHGKTRLVMPAFASKADDPPPPPPPSDEGDKGGKGNGDGDPPDLHPFIQGLLKELPASGTAWPEPQRKLWLDTAASIFKMIYKDATPQIPPPPGYASGQNMPWTGNEGTK